MLAAGLAVGVLTVPIIASVAEDALRAVPLALREASYGLGAKRAQTTFRVVFPAGISGIVAALILGISRAVRRWSWRSPPAPSAGRCSTSRRSNQDRR
jgi:phosphate transport system permease protein